MRKVIAAAIGLTLSFAHPIDAQSTDKLARIGVLAYLGYEDTLARWHGLKTYLDASLPDYSVEIVPVTLASASSQIASGQLDFILTNPGHFVDLSEKHVMSVIASRDVQRSDGSFSNSFGSLIFARADADITALSDAAGKRVAAVSKNAFGGFQLAWLEFESAGLNLFTDTEELVFVGFPMDSVVAHVASGRADIGIVRSGLMERMIADGHYSASDFTYLNAHATYNHPDRISTRLYPEWPFAALAQTDAALRDSVALALLSAKQTALSNQLRMRYFWSAPLPYQPVEDLTHAYAARTETQGTFAKLLRNWPLVLGTVIAPLAALLILLRRRRPTATPLVSTATPRPDLTKREQEILSLIADGFSSKEIARQLGISPKTVEFHRANLLKKFEARSSSQLVALASDTAQMAQT